MTRKEVIGNCALYLGDCLETLPQIKGASAVITDPPYGFGAYATDRDPAERLALLFAAAPMAAVFGYPETLVEWAIRKGDAPTEWITWWPTNGAAKGGRNAQTKLAQETECIAVWGQVQSRDALIVPRAAYSGVTNAYGQKDTKFLGDVWRDPSPGAGFNYHLRQHPNEKPLSLMERLLATYTAPGDVVLDPFMGSGTTGVACVKLGRPFIGVEVDEGHFETAVRRISEASRQGDLFAPASDKSLAQGRLL